MLSLTCMYEAQRRLTILLEEDQGKCYGRPTPLWQNSIKILSTYLPLPVGSIWHLIHPHLTWILFSSHPSSESSSSVHPLNVESPVYFRRSNLFTLHIPSPAHPIYSKWLKYQLNVNDSQICIFSSDLCCVSDPGNTCSRVPVTQRLTCKGTSR